MKKSKAKKDQDHISLNLTSNKVDATESGLLAELNQLSKQELLQRTSLLQAKVELFSSADSESYLAHELQLYQTELEMKNRELREAQQDLEISRDRYADLYDFAPVSYVTLDSEGVVKNINLTGASMLGEVRSGIVDRSFLKWVVRDDIDIYYRHLRDTLLTGKKNDEVSLKGHSGNQLDVRIESIRSWDKEEGVFYCQSVIIDISENKRAKNEIVLKARQLKLITDSLPVLIAYLNCHEKHLFTNKAYVDAFGVFSEGLKNKNAREIWGEKVYTTISPNLDIAYMGQQVNFDMELELTGAKKTYVNVIIGPDYDDNNIVQGVIIVIGDITERLMVEGIDRERLLNAANFARQSNMGELASEIAHELNQPLAAIAIYSDACRRLIKSDKATSDEIIQILADINDQAVRAGEVIRHIREFVNKKELQLDKVELNEMVIEALDLLKVELRTHNVELIMDLATGLPLIMADKILIEQVILNLSRNAIEAMDVIDKPKRLLKIKTTLDGTGEVEFRIEDAGPGLSAGEIKHIFQPFHTTKKNGMGLGLAIGKSVIDAHYGHLWVVPGNQRGSVFCFTLPIIYEDAPVDKKN